MRRAISCSLLAVLAVSFHLQAEVPPTGVPIVDDSIDVRVVNVEAVVTDRAGRRVHGLGAHDLRLRVDGREVPVEFFTEVEDGRSGAGPGKEGAPQARNYLVYLDDSFSLAPRRNAVLDKLEGDLSLLGPADRMAILAFDGTRIDVLADWTGDREQLRAALARARQRPAVGNRSLVYQRALPRDEAWAVTVFGGQVLNWTASGGGGAVDGGDKEGNKDQLNAVLEQMSHRTSPEARTQLGRTAPAIAATLGGFAAPPGRKVLLLVTGAWSLQVAPHVYYPLIALANQEGYTLYPVDTAQSDAREITGLDVFARATGGRALVSASHEVFRQAVADSGSYYWLGFTPAWKGDDRGHRITVEPLRPGLEARARTSFTDPSHQSRVALQAASILVFGGAKEDERLIVQLGADGETPKGRARRAPKTVQVPLTLGVPVESLLLTPEGTGFVAELPLAIQAEDGQHRRSDLPPLKLRVRLGEKPRAGTFARFRTVLELRNVDQRLVFTVQDPLSGHPVWGQAAIRPNRPGAVGAAGRDW